MSPLIKGYIENTLLDWEGKIASVIFFPGCDFRCGYCHAPHLVRNPNELETVPFASILSHVAHNRGWVDGIVLSGGEPTLQPELEDVIRELRARGMLIKLDTNGAQHDVLGHLLSEGLLDCVAMDIKAPFERYHEVVRVPVDVLNVQRSMMLLMDGDVDYEFRTTVCPAALSPEDVVQIARQLRGARRLVLQQFVPRNCLDPAMNDVTPYSRDELKRLAKAACRYVDECFVRGEPHPDTADLPA